MKRPNRRRLRSGATGGWRSALRELIRISRAVGADPDLVQGGGGNTSVKTRDGRTILVKASGTSLAAMDRERGWAALDLEKVRGLLSVPGLRSLPAKRREARVLELLSAAVLRPSGARPSVESNLHALLDRVVIHTHPVGLNALLCSRRGRRRCLRDLAKVLGKARGEPLYVPYIDPGYTLASRMEEEIAAYRRRCGRLPAAVLLENHGLFVAAPEVEECLSLSKRITDAGRRFLGRGRVNPLEFPALIPPAFEEAPMWEDLIRDALIQGGSAPVLLRRDRSPIADEFLRNPRALRAARKGAFTPDQIVYCRTCPLFLRIPEVVTSERDVDVVLAKAAEAVAEYRRRWKLDPRVVIVPGFGVYSAAPDLAQLRVVADVYRAALAAILGSARAGGPRFLSRPQAAFIEDWEVEAFRARLAEGARRRLRGRIAAVAGAASRRGAEKVRRLAESGATVVAMDRSRRALEALARKVGANCIPLAVPDRSERALWTACARVFGSLGGIDFFEDCRAKSE